MASSPGPPSIRSLPLPPRSTSRPLQSGHVDCGAGVDLLRFYKEMPGTDAIVASDLVGCERIEFVAFERVAEFRAPIEQARNRGRRAGDEATVALGSPLTLATVLNRAIGSSGPDVFTIPGPKYFPDVLALSRDAEGRTVPIVLGMPADGSSTDRDLVLARAGNDVIDAGPGADHVEGEGGDDTLRGSGGDDLLYGRTGHDHLIGGDDDDLIEGGRGRDRLTGGPGADSLNGGIDADRLAGGPGSDRLTSVDGRRDVVDCGAGRDSASVDRHDRVRGCERVSRRR